jgi:hypothetical protein
MNKKYAGLNLTEDEIDLIEASTSEVVDVLAFLEYTKTNKVLNRLAIYKATTGDIIDLRTPKHSLLGKILNLPQEEQDKLMLKRETVRGLMTKVSNHKRKAFGDFDKPFNQMDTLLVSKKAELLEYFGRMFNPKEVYQIIREEWKNEEIKLHHLNDFYKENFEVISAAVERHKNEYKDMRLVAKRSRLEELVALYNKARRKYESSSNREDGKFVKELLAEIRKETEGDVITINGNLNIQHNVVKAQAELLTGLNLKEIILGRVAAKMHMPSVKLIEDLNKSFYAKYNNLINGGEYIDYEEVQRYPSDGAYDFVHIKAINEEKEKEKQEEAKEAKVAAINNAQADDNKKNLLEKLKALTEKNLTDQIKTVKNTL